MSGYTGMTGSELQGLMQDAMTQAVNKTAKRIEVTAKKYAPVRKIFRGGAPKKVTRTFIDAGLPKNLRKKGSKPTRRVVTQTVNVQRSAKYSTSAKARQDFRIIDESEAFEFGPWVHGQRSKVIKPGVVDVYRGEGGGTVYAMFEGGGKNLSARGKWEVRNMLKGYERNVTAPSQERLSKGGALLGVSAGQNLNPLMKTITEPYVEGKIGGYPRGAKRSEDGKTISFERAVSRQTLIRVRDTKTIRTTIATAAAQSRKQKLPVYAGPEIYLSKPTEANPGGVLMARRTEAEKAKGKTNPRRATEHELQTLETHIRKTQEVKEANANRDDTYGGLVSRQFAAQMTPYERPDVSGAFHGAVLNKHFKLQVGGHLRESIQADYNGTKASVSANVHYAIYQEFGTSHHAAHPFLRPALYENRDLLRSAAKDKAKRALQSVRKG